MRKFVLTVAILALCANPASADSVGLFADNVGSSCNVAVTVSVPFSLYVIHKTTDGTTASQWKVIPPGGTVLPIGGQIGSGFLGLGDPYVDQSVVYTECRTGEFLIFTLNYLATGAVPNCTYVSLVEAPSVAIGEVLITDCNFFEFAAIGGQAILNSDISCDCNVATQQSTWGKVKSLYR